METMQKLRIHPLAAGAAVAVIIASAVAVAAMTGHLPGSNATPAPAVAQYVAPAPAPAPAALPPEPAPRQVVAAATSPSYAQSAPACPNCGVVESVSTYKQKPKHSVVGMVGGGVLGAVVGSQIGHGSTNTLATVGGAAGGAYLGNEVGKKYQAVTRYKVVLRMEDGHTRTVTFASPPAFAAGSHVRLENGRLVSDSG